MLKRSILQKAGTLFRKDPNGIFRQGKGVIHVGANTGQEIELYHKYGLAVIWIEPIPAIFETLSSNLSGYPAQKAVRGLVTDLDNVEYQFHLASNNGASSSILELNLHKDIWPEVSFEKTISLYSRTLPSLLEENGIDIGGFDILVMDTQGSELMVLKGALPILSHFTYIKTEVPDFESYKGCCQLQDLQTFLDQHGFREYSRHRFAKHPGGGSYYDVIYKRSQINP